MTTQSQIQRKLNCAASQSRIVTLASEERYVSRRAFGRRVCEEFGFFDARGAPQLAGCLKALRTLETRSPDLVLPSPQPVSVRAGCALLPEPVAPARDVPSRVSELAGFELVVVSSPAERRVWNTLMEREHPHGTTIFAGCQLRYLVRSAHGYLGGAGFSSAALRLAARDRWMAWGAEQRATHLNRVACLSRFLIRPGVACRNLASHVLGRILRRFPRDFERRYRFRPWLVETFLEPHYSGASLRAANFLRVGETAGRGRQDRTHRCAKPVKSVWMFELDRRWRRHLAVPFVDATPTLAVGEGLDAEGWAAHEFGGAKLGDKRLTARLVKSALLLAEVPGRAIHAHPACDDAAANGFYRLMAQPSETGVTVENIVAPHRERSIRRMRDQKAVLAIQDGTDFNFATRPHTEGLQLIGKNQTHATTMGLHLHATLAVSATGLPLGVLRLGFDDPDARADPNYKKTQRWFDGFRDTIHAAREVTGKTRVVAVCDREADVFELFDAQRKQTRVELLVRARHDRLLDTKSKTKLFETVRAGPPAGVLKVEVAGLTERPKSSRKKARPARSNRLANCELRHCRVVLPATATQARPLSVSVVHVVEVNPPGNEKPVEWYLLTTLRLDDAEDAADVVRYYLQRWRIEDFFRVLKSGCKAENQLFRSADRLQRGIAIHAVIAWRIMLMTLLGRQVPECSAELMFSEAELAFLRDYARRADMPVPQNLGDAVQIVARLGGWRGRTHDPEPGNQIMWHGYSLLTQATMGHEIGFEAGVRYAVSQMQTPVV